MKRVFISDCEGPISRNDNAFETTTHFVPNGAKLFTVISRYDDVLADITKKPRHRAGDTLKLVLPFLKAYGATDEAMHEFSARNLVLIQGAKDTLDHVRSITDAFIVSTSYEHYMKALCQAVNFPFENVYCTRFRLDNYSICENEKADLKQIAEKIAKLPVFEIPTPAKSLKDLPKEAQSTIKQLDEFFWNRIIHMEFGRIYAEVKPVGGIEKAEAIEKIADKLNVKLPDMMYVGDSITDEEAFKLLKKGEGLTVSFNGNQYAVKNADIAVLSENSVVTAIIADVFIRFGKEAALALAENWSRQTIRDSQVSKQLIARLFQLYPGELPKVRIVTSENVEDLADESSKFRKKVRGETIGGLG
jgi:energy-converting hydrogenase A subunit R